MMKILFVVHGFPPYQYAGTEQYTFSLAKSLKRLGSSSLVLCPKLDLEKDAIFDEYEGLSVLRLELDKTRENHPIKRYFCRKTENLFKHILKLYDPAIVHINHIEYFPLSIVNIVKQCKIPLVATLHDYYFFCERTHLFNRDTGYLCLDSQKGNECVACFGDVFYPHFNLSPSIKDEILRYEKAKFEFVFNILNKIDLLISPSQFLKKRFEAENEQISTKIKVIPHGIRDLPELEETIKKRNEIVFGYFGGLDKLKGIHILIEAFETIEGHYKLKVFGGVGYTLKKNNPNIHFYGHYLPKEINQVYSDIDVALVPSLSENYSLTTLEALYYKRPVIASRVGGIPEIIEDGINGFLVEPGDVRDLKEKIEMFLNSPELIGKLKKNIVVPKSSLKYAREIEDEYKKLLENKKNNNHRKSLKDGKEKFDFLKKVNELNFIKENVYWKGVFSFNKGKFWQAEQYFKKTFQIDEKNPLPYFYLEAIYFQQGKSKKAEEALKKTLSLELSDKNLLISIYYAIGSNYERQGQLIKAIEKFEYVISNEFSFISDINKFKSRSHFHLGCIYNELERKEEAKHHFKECLKLIPNHKKAREYLEVLNDE